MRPGIGPIAMMKHAASRWSRALPESVLGSPPSTDPPATASGSDGPLTLLIPFTCA